MSTDLLADLIHHTSPIEQRAKGSKPAEYHIACPWCGKDSHPRNPHFSFSENGYFCFVCGAKGKSLKALAEQVGLDSGSYVQKPVEARQTPQEAPPDWMLEPEPYLRCYERHPEKVRLWQDYKPVSGNMIRQNRLGVGVLPASKCKHKRLIVPVFDNGLLVGLRGRAIDCQCGKWLAPAGTRLERLPLYNAEALAPGMLVWIVENPIDALLVNLYHPESVGLATYSTAYWRDAWTDFLAARHPLGVVVTFDNDLPGNGGAWTRDEQIAEWLKTHDRVPEARGIKLTNDLIRAGLPAWLYDWADSPPKADMGSMLMECVG